MNTYVSFLGNTYTCPSPNQLEQSTVASSKPAICFPNLLISVPKVNGEMESLLSLHFPLIFRPSYSQSSIPQNYAGLHIACFPLSLQLHFPPAAILQQKHYSC